MPGANVPGRVVAVVRQRCPGSITATAALVAVISAGRLLCC